MDADVGRSKLPRLRAIPGTELLSENSNRTPVKIPADAILQGVEPIREVTDREITLKALPDFLRLVSLKDRSTHAHSQRVSAIASEWASYMRRQWLWLEVDLEAFETAALLHDIGKIGVLDEILLKPGALSPSERDHLEQHAEIGYQMIRDYPGAQDVADGIRHHHERWDGQGYPLGISGRRIPWFARAIAIVDAYDAMTNDRPYRQKMSPTEALDELVRGAGRQFDPDLVRDFTQFRYSQNT